MARTITSTRVVVTLETLFLCRKCGKEKPASEFRVRSNIKKTITSNCRDCWNEWRRINRATNPERTADEQWWDNLRKACRKQSITVDDYFRLYDEQDGKCAICEKELQVAAGKGKSASIDHSHDTGQVRGLLCGKCNTAIGLLDEDVSRFSAAASYLAKHPNHNISTENM